MKRLILFVIGCTLSYHAVAETPTPISRRDGFFLLWNDISRQAFPAKTAFTDLPADAHGSLEIDYAVARKIIDKDAEAFNPDAPLTYGTALTWLFRLRNVTDDPSEVSIATMTGMLARYPIAHIDSLDNFNNPIGKEDLSALMRSLDEQLDKEVHEVSLYAEKFHGKGTAFGETFDMHAMTAAHRSFPYNTLVKVTNVNNGKSVIVRINDRGPFVKGRDMDLSLAAFTSIENRSKGKFNAIFERFGDANLVQAQNCSIDATEQRRIGGGVALTSGVPRSFKLGEVLSLAAKKSFVVRGVWYPDGSFEKMQQFVTDGEAFTLKPSITGKYRFKVSAASGRSKIMAMDVVECSQ